MRAAVARTTKVVGLLASFVALACQPGMSTTPAVAPVPPAALGLPLYLTPDPTLVAVEDPEGRPLAMTFEHGVRDALEEAGFKLVPTPDAAAGIVVSVVIQRVASIHADLFIHGAEACGVVLNVTRNGTVLATAQPEAACVSTSAYYGMLPKDAAIALVNTVSHAPGLLAVAEAVHRPEPSPDGSPR